MADSKKIIKKLRKEILINSYKAGACHIGSALSCLNILVDLFYKRMKGEDIFIFSKASGVVALYCILADRGYFSKNKISHYLKHYSLASKDVPGVIHSVGSVGMGLSVAVGLAWSDRNRNVYCLVSDGQLDEGVSYEAALFARQHQLINLYVICDNNGLQACGRVNDILNLETAFRFFKETFPNFERVKTIKGDGVDFMRNDFTWHYKNLDKKLLNEALKQI